jgi:hypothetical protein
MNYIYIISFFFTVLSSPGISLAQKNNVSPEKTPPNQTFDKTWKYERATNQSITPSVDKKRDIKGSSALRFELNKSDQNVSNGKRAEMAGKSETSANVERWYSFSIFLPDDYETDSAPEIVAQWHANPDFELGETWRSPPISLRTNEGKWQLVVLWATDSVNTNKTISGRKIFDFGKYNRGQWTDWVFHIKFSYKEDGILEVWKNGAKIVNRRGPNYFNDKKGPYFKFGIYKWDWMEKKPKSRISKRVLYFDNVKIGDEDANYKTMNH